jgi:hypothetical protein
MKNGKLIVVNNKKKGGGSTDFIRENFAEFTYVNYEDMLLVADYARNRSFCDAVHALNSLECHRDDIEKHTATRIRDNYYIEVLDWLCHTIGLEICLEINREPCESLLNITDIVVEKGWFGPPKKYCVIPKCKCSCTNCCCCQHTCCRKHCCCTEHV